MNKRQREVIQHGLNSEEEVLEALKETYKKALEDVEKEIKLLTVDDAIQSKIFRKEYQEQLKQQISSVLDAMNSGQFKTIDEYVKACYTDSFIGTMYDIAGQGVPLIIPIDQNQLIRAVSLNSKLSKSLYESLGENVDDLKKTVTQEISRGIATASNWRDIARNISYNMMGDYSQTRGSMAYAYRIARTEGHRIQNEAALHAQKEAKKNGADVVKQWDATLDGATRPNHRLLDGQIRELDEMFSVPGMSADAPGCSGIAAEDINCRCTLLQRARWALDEEELETLKERAEYYGLSEEKANTFEEYEKNYLKAVDNGADSGGVRSDAQKINDENALENNGKSDKIISKSVEIPEDCSFLLKAETNFEGKDVDVNVLKTIDKEIEKQTSKYGDFGFDEIKLATFGQGDKSVFITNYQMDKGVAKTQLYLNKEYFAGKPESSVNQLCTGLNESGWWNSKNLGDLVNHEIMHARINGHNSFEKAEQLYQMLEEDERVKGLCGLVDKYPSEFMNEMYVALENGTSVEQKYIDLYNEYAKEYLKG